MNDVSRGSRILIPSLTCLILMGSLFTFAQKDGLGEGPRVLRNPDVFPPVYPTVIDIDLRTLSPKEGWKPGDPIKEIPRKTTSRAIEVKPEPHYDGLVDLQNNVRMDSRALSTPTTNFAGQGYTGVNPPDTVGDVGPNYYIQSINGGGGALYVIYNKNGTVAAGPFSMESLGTGQCGSGLGDPIILYDELAGRWMISEFSNAGNQMCVYVSQTSNPISGGWYNYSFSGNSFPDYPKYGVWPDAYYVGTNESTLGIYAFDRQAMLSGSAASSQRFSTSKLSGFGFQMLQPADHDGATAPPSGAPGIFMRHRDTEVHSGLTDASNDYLEIFEFSVDWTTPSNSTLTGPIQIAVSEFDSTLCGLTSFACIPQPGTSTTLDPLREVVMQRLAYRNFGSHETLVGNLVTDVNGSDRAGVRWFELRKTSGSWSLYQEGTVSLDATNRWMGAIAMDGSGNIALGYNVSSSSVSPGLRYVGRLATDTLGTMTQGEYTIVNGSASNGSNRYGDYAAMGIDPADDCTFWFTGEYNTSSQWSTRIASFSFSECGCTPPAAPTGVNATPNGNNRIDVTYGSVAGATYRIYRADGSCPGGSYSLVGTSSTTTYIDTAVSGGQTYAYVVTAFIAAQNCESAQSSCASATANGACTASPSFAGATSAASQQTATCAIQVNWSAGSSNCGGSVSYNVYRSTSSGFTPGSGNLEASCLSGTNYVDTNVTSGTTYYYVVRAEDGTSNSSGPCNSGNEDSNTAEVSATPTGPSGVSFNSDFEGTLTDFGVSGTGGNAWVATTSQSNSPSTSAFCDDEAIVKDQSLVLVTDQNLPAGSPATMSFYHWYNTESGFDGGVLEYSTNAGSTWSDIGSSRITSNGYNSTISTSYSSPIGGRAAWSGNSGGFIQSTVNLADFAGSTIRFRWRMACDTSIGATGWWVDDIAINAGSACTTGGGCTYAISPSSASYSSSGGTGSISVTAPSGCAWTATSNNGWITITSGASGSGNGSVGYSVAANTATSARAGTITAAGQTFTVNQAAASGGGSWVTINNNNFESGFGIWNDGGSDCRRSSQDSAYANSGNFCIRLRDNSGSASSMFTNAINASAYSNIRITFYFYPRSMDGTTEDFFVEVNNGGGWQVAGQFVVTQDFTNNNPQTVTVTAPSGFTPNASTQIRIRCDASGNSDWIYVDDALIEGFQ
jgi:fibronectin type 3 domain-containing protein